MSTEAWTQLALNAPWAFAITGTILVVFGLVWRKLGDAFLGLLKARSEALHGLAELAKSNQDHHHVEEMLLRQIADNTADAVRVPGAPSSVDNDRSTPVIVIEPDKVGDVSEQIKEALRQAAAGTTALLLALSLTALLSARSGGGAETDTLQPEDVPAALDELHATLLLLQAEGVDLER